MAGLKRAIFELDDDDDSVPTDSTESFEEGEYEVEKILLEERDQQTGEMKYLVKWVGYPLHDATFELVENLTCDTILEGWERQKGLIEQGRAERFLMQTFIDAFSINQERKASRRLRRDAKREQRRKHALAAFQSADTADEHDRDEREIPISSPSPKTSPKASMGDGRRSSQTKHQAPKSRRGVARPVPKRVVLSSSDEMSEEEREVMPSRGSSVNPLREEIPDRASSQNRLNKSKASPSTNKASHPKPTTTIGSPRTDPSSPTKAVAPISNPPKSPRANPEATVKAAIRPGVQTAKRTNIRSIMTNWEADKKKRPAPRVTRQASTDSNNPLFQNLAVQNSFQKYSRSEPVPDFSSLIIVDPKTGKFEPKKIKTTSTAAAPSIPSEYRRTPPPPQRPRSISPPPNRGVARRDSDIDQSRPPIHRKGSYDTKSVTCSYWRAGHCMKSENVCAFAHRDTGTYSNNSKGHGYKATCFWWKHGGCKKSDCENAHFETGRMQVLHTKRFTCYYWQKGHCMKSEEDCQFAHCETGFDNVKSVPGKTDGAGSDANSMPLGERKTARDVDNMPMGLSGPDLRIQTDVSRAGGSVSSAAIEASPMDMIGSPTQLNSARKRTGSDAARHPPGRRDIAPNIMKDGTMYVQPEGATEPWLLKARFEPVELASFLNLVGPSPRIQVDCAVNAADARVILFESSEPASRPQASGDLTFDSASLGQAESLALTCKLHNCGLLATLKEAASRMVIFPSNTEEWKFLEANGHDHPAGATFRFQIFQCPQGLHALAVDPSIVPVPSVSRAKANLAQQLGSLDVKRFFHADEKKGMDRAVFLIIPPEHRDELDVYVRFFNALKSRVYSSDTPGAWSYVREHHRSCLLIVHPEIPLWQVPGLFNFINVTGAGLRIFSMGIHKSQAILEGRPPRFECLRLFPHGTVYLITDEVFLYQPELATQIINQYLDQHKNKPEGGENDRIAARPGVKQWLLDLAREKTVGSDRGWIDLWAAICQLCPLEDEDPRDPLNLLPTSNLISVSPDLMPHFYTLLKQQDADEFAPTDWMVNWFAGWSLCHATEFRRFIVCHRPKKISTPRSKVVMDEFGRWSDWPEPVDVDPRGWAAQYQHIGVMRPETCIKRRK